jgi:hypothetical protein
VAGALVMLGTSSVAAAGIASSMVIVFGGTGAGLAGYRMRTRTQGLTDFGFQQYDEKVHLLIATLVHARPLLTQSITQLQDKMEVMIMVSGWMEEDEDDKRTFGVVPDHMGFQERLTRFYRINDKSR